jgi:hypothetical protein
MYLSATTFLATILLSTARGEHATASASSDPILHRLSVSDLSAEASIKVLKFRDEFLLWKDEHSVVYGSIQSELNKMLVWVDNHGELVGKSVNRVGLSLDLGLIRKNVISFEKD